MFEESTVYLFYQNIRGLCFSEHHLNKFELGQINVDGYVLGAACSRRVVKRGAVCIFVQKT